MKTATFALLLCCTAAALAQSPAEKPVYDNMMYTYRAAPRISSPSTRSFDFVYEPSYKYVKPPLEDFNINRKTYPVNNQSGAVIVYPSGTSIYIPRDAFVDETGKEIEGNVTVSYREFKNPTDFIFSGIPMSYESEGKKNMFISAGMFELTAAANGKPTYLKENKKIEMEMVSMDKRPDYNLYAFNDSTGEWEERESKNNIAVTEVATSDYSPAVNSYLRFLSYNSRLRPVDTVSCRRRFERSDYFYTNKSNGAISFRKNRWWSKGHSYNALIKITNVRKNKKDGSITFRIGKAVANTHPELGIYNRTSWKVENMSLNDFKKTFGNKNGFFDVRIEKEGDDYHIKLKGANGFAEITATPMRLNKENKIVEYSSKIKNNLYKIYSRLLKSREKTFDKQIARDLKKYKKAISPLKKEQLAWNSAKYIMTAEEKNKPFEDWKAYVEIQKKVQRKISDGSAANSSNIIRSFSVDGMGIWNCDQIYRLNSPVTVLAKYMDADGNKIKSSYTYVVDKSLNGVLSYGGSEISFSTTAYNVFIVVKEGGEIAYATSADMQDAFENGRGYVFALKNVSSSATTVEDLRKLIGM